MSIKLNRWFCFIMLCIGFGDHASGQAQNVHHAKPAYKIITRECVVNNRLSADWQAALATRMPVEKIRALAALHITVTKEEMNWMELIRSKEERWSRFLDSLAVAFNHVVIPDTTYIYLGHSGVDDGFTYKLNTVCFDPTALQNNYGAATLAENAERIDRFFAHEFTHLLHKSWAKHKQLELKTFRDSILWECIYEGIGMYRSLTKKWLPANGVLPAITKQTMEELTPVFVERLIEIETVKELDSLSKERIGAGLSRGQVNKKWGAFPVAIWLAQEASTDERKLSRWLDLGPDAVIMLAKKYLPETERIKFETVYW